MISPAGAAIFPSKDLSPAVLPICSDSLIPGLWPMAASDPAIMISLL